MRKMFMPVLLALFLLLSACTTGNDSPTAGQTGIMPTPEPTVVSTQGATEAPQQTLPADPTQPETEETTPAATEPPAAEPAETKPAATEPPVTEPAESEPAATEPAETEPADDEPAIEDMTPIA